MTGTRCAHCPAAEGLSCRGGVFCDWAAAGDPIHLRHITAVALCDAGRPMPPQPAVPCRDATPAPAPALPLAGDLVAAATARIGLDRLAKYVAEQLGAECGCPERQEKLNRLDGRLRRWLGMG